MVGEEASLVLPQRILGFKMPFFGIPEVAQRFQWMHFNLVALLLSSESRPSSAADCDCEDPSKAPFHQCAMADLEPGPRH